MSGNMATGRCRLQPSTGQLVRFDLLLRPAGHNLLLLDLFLPGGASVERVSPTLDQLLRRWWRHRCQRLRVQHDFNAQLLRALLHVKQ